MRGVRLLPALAAIAVLALLAGGCGDKKVVSKTSSAAPQQRVTTALANIQKVKSGVVKLDATISGAGMPGAMKVTGGGEFDLNSPGGAAFDLEIDLNIAGQNQKMGFVAVDGKSYMKMGDRAFAMGDTKKKKGSTSSTGSLGSIKPDEIRKLIDSLDEYLSDFKETGTVESDGQTLTVYTARVDTKKLSSKVQKETGSKIPEVPGLGDLGSLTSMFGDIAVRIGVGDDELPHSLGFETKFGATGSEPGMSGTMKASLELSKVNEPVTIKVPKNVVEGAGGLEALGSLFGGMGSAMGGGATGTMGGSSDGQ